jgi:hypothetical protein
MRTTRELAEGITLMRERTSDTASMEAMAFLRASGSWIPSTPRKAGSLRRPRWSTTRAATAREVMTSFCVW